MLITVGCWDDTKLLQLIQVISYFTLHRLQRQPTQTTLQVTAESPWRSNATSRTYSHHSSMPTVVFDWQGMTSYWCSTVTSGLDRTVVELWAMKSAMPWCQQRQRNEQLLQVITRWERLLFCDTTTNHRLTSQDYQHHIQLDTLSTLSWVQPVSVTSERNHQLSLIRTLEETIPRYLLNVVDQRGPTLQLGLFDGERRVLINLLSHGDQFTMSRLLSTNTPTHAQQSALTGGFIRHNAPIKSHFKTKIPLLHFSLTGWLTN